VEDALPLVTVIIPTRPGQLEVTAVDAARRLDYPRDKMEILIVRGKQPAIQRNVAIKAARGEIIYFLDDDSQPQPDSLRRAIEHFRDPAVQMVGGPNLCPVNAPFLEQVFAVTLSSWIAFGPSRARYDRVGKIRATGEKELILCNLLARRSTLLELGGFDESLYPNEENALMDDLQKRGGKLIYDPDVIAFRRPRPTLKAFCKMLLTYGRGRAEQFRLHPTPGSALNFVPPLFVLYLALIPLWAWFGWFHATCTVLGAATAADGHIKSVVCESGPAWVPLFAYALTLGFQTVINCGKGIARGCCALPLLFATHALYGLGFWRGLFTRVEHSTPVHTEVELERVSVE
jgi:hypothetical protein